MYSPPIPVARRLRSDPRMLLSDLSNSGALSSLTATLSMAGRRQRELVHNIANMDTPDFRPRESDIRAFQRQLREAVDRRRESPGAIEAVPDALDPNRSPSRNILYHDRNNRDVETMMKDLAENALTFRLASDLIRRENDLLRVAISQRV